VVAGAGSPTPQAAGATAAASRSRRSWSSLLGLLLAGVVLLAGCGGDGPRFGMPEAISEDGEDVLGLWRGSFMAALAVGALVWGLVVWAAVRYRRRNDDLPSQSPENIPLEITYTAVPLVIVAVLFGFTYVTQDRVTALSDDPDVVVEVTAFQWSWRFSYPEEGVEVVSDGNTPPRLVVPVGATVRFDLETADVVHNFWVPELLTKRDIIPDVENAIDVEVTSAGSWTGRCAEFCGLEHYAMIFTFEAAEPAAYESWLDERRQAGDVVPDSAADEEVGDAEGDEGAGGLEGDG
jgi:cytochrome c oxidase subunit 2